MLLPDRKEPEFRAGKEEEDAWMFDAAQDPDLVQAMDRFTVRLSRPLGRRPILPRFPGRGRNREQKDYRYRGEGFWSHSIHCLTSSFLEPLSIT